MEEKEISEVLLDIADDLKKNSGQPWDLTNDCGDPTVFDARSELYVREITIDKVGDPVALVPLGWFENETVRAIAELMKP